MANAPTLKLVRPTARDFPGDSVAAGPEIAALLGPSGSAGHDSVRTAVVLAESLFRGAALASGEPAFGHAVGAATLVSELKLEGEAIAAALLAPVAEIGPENLGAVKERCGAVVAELVEGVARMA